jgi:hypothetical protein
MKGPASAIRGRRAPPTNKFLDPAILKTVI